MGDHQDGGLLFAPDGQQFFLQFFFGDRIEGPEGFIEHQHLGANGKGAGDGNPLTHTTRNLIGAFGAGIDQTHHLQVVLHYRGPRLDSQLRPGRAHGQIHVLLNGLPGQQGIVLKHHHPIRAGAANRLSAQQHLSARRLQEARNHIEQGRFAAAGMADHTNKLRFLDLQIDLAKGFKRAALG